MPNEQNNETSNVSSGRIKRIKAFLLIGPYAIMIIPIILCVILICKVTLVSKDIRDNNEVLEGVIMQQGDLSTQVYELIDAQDVLSEEVARLSDEVSVINGKINTVHPGLTTQRDENALPKRVHLTFDDGPSGNTAEILDILKQYGVKATFFAVGKETEASKELYKRIVDEGHTLGMHSYSHVYKDIYSSRDSFENDLNRISSLLTEVTGKEPKFYRFPGGSNNTLIGNRYDEFASVLDERGIAYFDWNVSTGDATNPALPAEEIVENALADIDKYEDVVILMHDLGNKDTTVEALPTIIERLQSEGIPIEPITESTKLIQYH